MAIGVSGEDLQIGSENIINTGAVNVIYGSLGSGLTATGNQVWHQDSPGIVGVAETNDMLGESIAAGDFNKDGADDLAIGVFREGLQIGFENRIETGAVNVIYGSLGSGLTATGNQVWHQDSPGILGVAETSDFSGEKVAAGDFNKDGADDLAIGVSHEDLQIGSENIINTGAVNVIYGSQDLVLQQQVIKYGIKTHQELEVLQKQMICLVIQLLLVTLIKMVLMI